MQPACRHVRQPIVITLLSGHRSVKSVLLNMLRDT
jgi:hypothetical protein